MGTDTRAALADRLSKLPPLRLSQAELDALGEYSATVPTGTTPGKRWKRNIASPTGGAGAANPVWMVGEYGEPFQDPRGERFGMLSPITWYRPVIDEPALARSAPEERPRLSAAVREAAYSAAAADPDYLEEQRRIARGFDGAAPEERGEGDSEEVERLLWALRCDADAVERHGLDGTARMMRARLDKLDSFLLASPPAPVEGEREDWRLADDSRLSEDVCRIVAQVRRDDRGSDEATDAILLLVERALASHPVQGAGGGEREMRCEKCDGRDIYTRYRKKGEYIDDGYPDYERARKDCLRRYCRTCGDKWTDPLASPAPSAPEEGDPVIACPVCGGRGVVQLGFYGDWGGAYPVSAINLETCRTCNGTTVYPPPIASPAPSAPEEEQHG